MSEDRYSVIFEGKLIKGYDKNKSLFALRNIGLNDDAIKKLIEAKGKPILNSVHIDKAQKIFDALTNCGLQCKLIKIEKPDIKQKPSTNSVSERRIEQSASQSSQEPPKTIEHSDGVGLLSKLAKYQWVIYIIFFYVYVYFLPRMPLIVFIASCWMPLTVMLFSVHFYFYILKKTVSVMVFQPKGWATCIYNLRNIIACIIFVLSAISIFLFIFHYYRMDATYRVFWVITGLSFSYLIKHIKVKLTSEVAHWYNYGLSLKLAVWIAPLILSLLYLGIQYFSSHHVYANLEAAIDDQMIYFYNNSYSVLLKEVDYWFAIFSGCESYISGQSKIFKLGIHLYEFISCYNFFFITCSFFAFLEIPRSELYRIFAPLSPGLRVAEASKISIAITCFALLITMLISANIPLSLESYLRNDNQSEIMRKQVNMLAKENPKTWAKNRIYERLPWYIKWVFPLP